MSTFQSADRSRLTLVTVVVVAAAGLLTFIPRMSPDAQASQSMAISRTPVPFVWQGPAPIADDVDWNRIDAAIDFGPSAVAAY
ncbi:MAG: hypothetical protein ABIO71_04330 [Caldimonas sp.]